MVTKHQLDLADTSDMYTDTTSTPTLTNIGDHQPSQNSTVGTGTYMSGVKGRNTFLSQRPNKLTMDSNPGHTNLVGKPDGFGTHHITIFEKPSRHQSLKDFISVSDQKSKFTLRPYHCLTEYHLEEQNVNRTANEPPVDQIDVFHEVPTPAITATDEQMESMVPEEIRELCENWKQVKIEIHHGESLTEVSQALGSMLSQG